MALPLSKAYLNPAHTMTYTFFYFGTRTDTVQESDECAGRPLFSSFSSSPDLNSRDRKPDTRGNVLYCLLLSKHEGGDPIRIHTRGQNCDENSVAVNRQNFQNTRMAAALSGDLFLWDSNSVRMLRETSAENKIAIYLELTRGKPSGESN